MEALEGRMQVIFSKSLKNVCGGGHAYATVYTWRWVDNFSELVFSSILELRLSGLHGKCLYRLSHLAGLRLDFTWASGAGPPQKWPQHLLYHREGLFCFLCPHSKTDSAVLRPSPASSGQSLGLAASPPLHWALQILAKFPPQGCQVSLGHQSP